METLYEILASHPNVEMADEADIEGYIEDSDNSGDEDEDKEKVADQYEYVYATDKFKKFIDKETAGRFANWIFFQTYGGGPAGGYLWDRKDNTVYSVHCNWGKEPVILPHTNNAKLNIAFHNYGFSIKVE
jgi:hypothetical protein